MAPRLTTVLSSFAASLPFKDRPKDASVCRWKFRSLTLHRSDTAWGGFVLNAFSTLPSSLYWLTPFPFFRATQRPSILAFTKE
jgi:hypothetical protein